MAAAWCSTFLLKAFVNRVDRRIDIRIVRLWRSTYDVEMCFGSGVARDRLRLAADAHGGALARLAACLCSVPGSIRPLASQRVRRRPGQVFLGPKPGHGVVSAAALTTSGQFPRLSSAVGQSDVWAAHGSLFSRRSRAGQCSGEQARAGPSGRRRDFRARLQRGVTQRQHHPRWARRSLARKGWNQGGHSSTANAVQGSDAGKDRLSCATSRSRYEVILRT